MRGGVRCVGGRLPVVTCGASLNLLCDAHVVGGRDELRWLVAPGCCCCVLPPELILSGDGGRVHAGVGEGSWKVMAGL